MEERQHAFPVSVTVLVLEDGFSSWGAQNHPDRWLLVTLGTGQFATTPHESVIGVGVEFHFRALEDAQGFLERFPQIVLADATMDVSYRSPAVPFGKKTDRGVTNVRNTASPHSRRWLSVANRYLVPFTKLAEPQAGGGNAWFSVQGDRPAFFAGVLVPAWTSVRKVKDGETTDDLFAFLTTDPNAEVKAVHPKAMPVVLTEPEDWQAWLNAPWADAAKLQRSLPDGMLVKA